MDWRDVIIDFNGLVTELVQRRSRYKVADLLSRDKKTINGWLGGAMPSDPHDVAWIVRIALQNGVELSRFQSFAPIYDFSSMLSYEELAQKGPLDLSWLTSAQPPPVLKTNFCGLELDCPIGVASSPLLADDRWAESMLNLGFGLSTFKTKRGGYKQAWLAPHIAFVFEQPDLMNYTVDDPPDVLVTFSRREIQDSIPNLVNSIGAPSESPAMWQEMYERIKLHPRGRYVGISVMGDGDSKRELTKEIELAVEKGKEVAPPFIELNLSCPNLERGVDVYGDPSLVRQICSKARRVLEGTGIPLIIKLPGLPYTMMHDLLKEVGKYIDAVAFRNTVRVRPVTRDRDGKLQPAFVGRQFAGLSGPCTFKITRSGLHDLTKLRTKLGLDFGIVAIGGVATPGHVVELLDAGADVIQACTAPMFDPLLAWKVRFHIRQFRHHIPEEKALPFLQPRDQAEIDSFRDAMEAYAEIQRRFPERAIPSDVFREKWNAWMEQRPSAPVGKAHRLSSRRTFAQWIRDFTS
jgi:dihydroorotate dehydrogenase